MALSHVCCYFAPLLQVREMAATTLSGFLQCNFLTMDAEMQAHFEALCKTRLPKRKRRELGSAVDTIPSAGKTHVPLPQHLGSFCFDVEFVF